MNVAPFNFDKPVSLQGRFKRQIDSWFSAFCALAPKRWRRHFPFSVEFAFQGYDTLHARGALDEIPEAAMGHRVAFGSEKLNTMLVFPRPLVLFLLKAMIGDESYEMPEDRELTIVEESISQYLLQNLILNVFREALVGDDGLEIELGDKVPNPKWTRIFSPDENIVTFSFLLKADVGQQEWHWLIPQAGLTASICRDDTQEETEPDQQNVAQLLQDGVRRVPLTFAVRLGSVELPVEIVSKLRAGDLIILDQCVNDPLTASIAGDDRCRGWAGRVGARQAFQVEFLGK